MAKNLKRDIDLLAVYSHEETFFERNKTMVILGSIGGTVVLAALVVFIVLFVQNMMTRSDISDLNNEKDQLQAQIDAAAADPTAIAYNQMVTEINYLNSIDSIVFQYEELSRDVLVAIDRVSNSATVEDISYSQADGSIELAVTGNNENVPPQFITALKGTGAFSSVKYSGWSSNEGESVSFNVSLIISQSGGEDDE